MLSAVLVMLLVCCSFCYGSSLKLVDGWSSCDVLWCCVFVVIVYMFVWFASFCVMLGIVLYMCSVVFSICMCSLTSTRCLLICVWLVCFYLLYLFCVWTLPRNSKHLGSIPWMCFSVKLFVLYSELMFLLEFGNDLEMQRATLPPRALLISVDSCRAFKNCL